jgi:hypothetical protein
LTRELASEEEERNATMLEEAIDQFVRSRLTSLR